MMKFATVIALSLAASVYGDAHSSAGEAGEAVTEAEEAPVYPTCVQYGMGADPECHPCEMAEIGAAMVFLPVECQEKFTEILAGVYGDMAALDLEKEACPCYMQHTKPEIIPQCYPALGSYPIKAAYGACKQLAENAALTDADADKADKEKAKADKEKAKAEKEKAKAEKEKAKEAAEKDEKKDHDDHDEHDHGEGEEKAEGAATPAAAVAAAKVALEAAKQAVEAAGCNDAAEADVNTDAARQRREAHAAADPCVALVAAVNAAESTLSAAEDVIGSTSAAATVGATLVAAIAVIGGAAF